VPSIPAAQSVRSHASGPSPPHSRHPEFALPALPLDADTAHRFHILGLRTLGYLAGLPPRAVLAQFGPHGLFLHRLARGKDDRPGPRLVPWP